MYILKHHFTRLCFAKRSDVDGKMVRGLQWARINLKFSYEWWAAQQDLLSQQTYITACLYHTRVKGGSQNYLPTSLCRHRRHSTLNMIFGYESQAHKKHHKIGIVHMFYSVKLVPKTLFDSASLHTAMVFLKNFRLQYRTQRHTLVYLIATSSLMSPARYPHAADDSH